MTQQGLDRSSGLTTVTIPEVLRLAASGKLRIPHFQRSFVWDADDVLSLFDSIYRGFPIGTLLLWRRPAPEDFYMVVDGQQRVTSLIRSLSSKAVQQGVLFDVFFDLERRRFIGPNPGRMLLRAIPARELVDSRSVVAWLRDHGDDLADGDFDVADDVGAALRSYVIPVYVIEGDDERLPEEVFDRVNSSGKPMARAQVFHAILADGTELASSAMVAARLRPLQFGDIPESRISESLRAIRGEDVQPDSSDDRAADEADWYEQTVRALDRVIRFLQSIGVGHQKLLPSSFPLPVLAAFFHLYPTPEPETLRLLERWLWRGWVHGFYADDGETVALRDAVRAVNPGFPDNDRVSGEFAAVSALLEQVSDAPADGLRSDGLPGAPREGMVQWLNSRMEPSRRPIPPLRSMLVPDPEGEEGS